MQNFISFFLSCFIISEITSQISDSNQTFLFSLQQIITNTAQFTDLQPSRKWAFGNKTSQIFGYTKNIFSTNFCLFAPLTVELNSFQK